MPGSNGKVSNAIAVIEECRKIHEEWAKFQRKNPRWQELVLPESVGDADHHEEWVRKYDEVLEVLRSVHDGD